MYLEPDMPQRWAAQSSTLSRPSWGAVTPWLFTLLHKSDQELFY